MTPQAKHRLLVTQQEQQDEQRLLEHGLGPTSSIAELRTQHSSISSSSQQHHRSTQGHSQQVQSPARSYSTVDV